MAATLIILASLLLTAAGEPLEPSTTLVRERPWRDFKFRLLVPEASGGKSAITEIDAKLNTYRVPGAGYSFTIVVLYDPHSKRTCVVPGISRFRDFYVSADTGVLGVNFGADGVVQWVRSFVEIPGSALDLDEAVKRFEREFDETKASRHLARAVSLDVNMATGPGILDQPVTQVDVRADTDGRVLHLDLANPGMAKTAGLWIDLRASRIVRAQFWAAPSQCADESSRRQAMGTSPRHWQGSRERWIPPLFVEPSGMTSGFGLRGSSVTACSSPEALSLSSRQLNRSECQMASCISSWWVLRPAKGPRAGWTSVREACSWRESSASRSKARPGLSLRPGSTAR